ncbi:uncharacterized protein [Oryza sativa Japonica Group]|uniref:Protein YIP n=4 Tax=Oryza TaxID=4527 RepID=B9FJD8_ORYSJ|nr:protein YIPF1 homolog isoform X1 [Oryza sativa Japonica Group]KAB8099715.1 hypothetical protein EE612_029929 [Oryza sativa]AAU90216.1 unknow protein [Oryza sativa Japonica Group]EEE63957.1 hypothetical protein OsJ_18782 [Oryza sativa Japonica Group]KAF2931089.1 hypothetical protein DAI22_05g184300 [Oryza sativa Japonica Group]KAF2931090.1 hypothetical protein DAI22_05g184300 [Oryza sativa Japonica Group]|eukprot:NP_001055726.1 Os05g0455800 [Oryza sativa Japonica Group]
MDEGYANLPTSHLLGSVPAALTPEERKPSPVAEVGTSRLQQFPPALGGTGGVGGGGGGYQPPGTPADGDVETQTNWKGYFNVASYAPYFNVDTDVVVDRLISSVYPMDGFFRKIDANPDMYGPLWITTTLIFMLAAFGNFATYLMQRKTDLNIWSFDVGYFNWAASVMYGYAAAVPAIFFFLFQYFGSRPSLVRFWCMWGYSLFIFIPASVLLLIPVEFLRWVIIILVGGASSWFISLNLKECTEGADMMVLIASAAVLQFTLALFIKVFFFA